MSFGKFSFASLILKLSSIIKWGLVGSLTFAIDYFLFIVFFTKTDSVIASNMISSLIATSFNYSAHYFWTFKSSEIHSKSVTKYLLNLFVWFITSTILIKLLILAGTDPKLAKLAPLFFIAPINYFILHHLIFKGKS